MLQPRKWHKTITGLDKTAVFHYSQLGSRPFCRFFLDSMTLRIYGSCSMLALGSWMKLSSFQALCFKYEISKWLRKIFSELLSRFYDSNTETSDKTSTSTLSISFQVFCLANLRSKGPPPSVAPRFNLCGHNYCQTRQDWDFLRRNWWLFCSPYVYLWYYWI